MTSFLYQRRLTLGSLVIGVLGLSVPAQAAPVLPSSVRFQQYDRFGGTEYTLLFEVDLPAAFPRPARTVDVKLDCNTRMSVNSSDLADFTAAQQATLTDTSLSFGAFKATCLKGTLSVSHPQLFTWLIPKIEDLSDLGDATQYGPDSKGFAFTKDRLHFAVFVGINDSTVFERAGSTLRVMDNVPSTAVSLSQGPLKAAPMALGKQQYKPVTLNVQQAFTLHTSDDKGRSWHNITVNLAQPSLTFWTSAQPGGPTGPTSGF